MVGLSGNGAAYHIDDTQYLKASLLCLSDCRQRICRFTGLADGYDHPAFLQNRVPVAEFRSQIHFHRDPCQSFQHIFACHPCMVRRAAGNNMNLFDRLYLPVVKSQLFDFDLVLFNPGCQGIGHCTRLFIHFL